MVFVDCVLLHTLVFAQYFSLVNEVLITCNWNAIIHGCLTRTC